MMSTSFKASCLRIANISSCLRIVLAFSISCSSANARSSGGDLDFRSWSFISRMRVVLKGVSAGALKQTVRAERYGRKGAGLGCRLGLRRPHPDAPVVQYAGPGLQVSKDQAARWMADAGLTPTQELELFADKYFVIYTKR